MTEPGLSTASGSDSSWQSVYLFFEGDVYQEPADRLLLETVTPLAEDCLRRGLADGWFFIRYLEKGSHLRLRLRRPAGASESDARALTEAIEEAVAEARAAGLATGHQWVPYEPELQRYGGPAGMGPAEGIFQVSSEVAAGLLAKVPPGDRPARFGKALLSMLVLLHGFTGSRELTAEMGALYGHSYLRALVPDPEQLKGWLAAFEDGFERQSAHLAEYVEAAWQALEEGEELTPELDRYRRDLAPLRSRLRALTEEGDLSSEEGVLEGWPAARRHLVPSYLHMMNNRLGVSIQEESYLSVLIHFTLEPRALARQRRAGATGRSAHGGVQ